MGYNQLPHNLLQPLTNDYSPSPYLFQLTHTTTTHCLCCKGYHAVIKTLQKHKHTHTLKQICLLYTTKYINNNFNET